jgi:hypothetical protein
VFFGEKRRRESGFCRDGMGPRNPTNSLTQQSRPAPLPVCIFLRGGLSILHGPLACYVMRGEVSNGHLFISVRASQPLLSTTSAMERLLSQKQGGILRI